MDELMYEGKLYKRGRSRKWAYNNETVPETLQRKLNNAWADQENWTAWSDNRLADEGKRCKESGDMDRAIKYFELLRSRNPEGGIAASILASLSSCYRDDRVNRPDKCVELYQEYRERGNHFLNPAFLTSVAAAYIDIGDLYTARDVANHARAILGDRNDFNLAAVYQRLHAEGL